MILANTLVAEKIYKFSGSKTLLRKQDPYPLDALEELKNYIAVNKIALDLSSTLNIEKSLEAMQKKDDKMYQCVSRKLMTKMRGAVYACVGNLPFEQCSHFALGLPLYTHFTSPIRRYADLIVHRLLHSIILATEAQKSAETFFNSLYDARDFVENISEKYKNGKNAGKAHEKLFYSFLLRDKGMLKCRAFVYDVDERRICIYVPSIDFEKNISMKDQKLFGIERFDFDKEARTMKLTFKDKKAEKEKNNGKSKMKYIPVKKSTADPLSTDEALPKEVTLKAFDTIIVGLYIDDSIPMELKVKILKS